MVITKFLDPTNDIAFHRIFGTERNKDILIHFVNDILEYQFCKEIKEVTFLSTIQDPDIAAKKQSIVDILCKDEDGVQIIVQMQVAPQVGFEKRAQYYASKAYCNQFCKDGRYIDLKAIIFIAISEDIIFTNNVTHESNPIILDSESHSHDSKDFFFKFIELPKFQIKDISQLTNIVQKWYYFFKYATITHESELQQIVGKDHVIERAFEELNRFNWTEGELFAYEREIKRQRDNRAAEDYIINRAKAEILNKLLHNGFSKESIAEMFDMNIAEIEELLKE